MKTPSFFLALRQNGHILSNASVFDVEIIAAVPPPHRPEALQTFRGQIENCSTVLLVLLSSEVLLPSGGKFGGHLGGKVLN